MMKKKSFSPIEGKREIVGNARGEFYINVHSDGEALYFNTGLVNDPKYRGDCFYINHEHLNQTNVEDILGARILASLWSAGMIKYHEEM